MLFLIPIIPAAHLSGHEPRWLIYSIVGMQLAGGLCLIVGAINILWHTRKRK